MITEYLDKNNLIICPNFLKKKIVIDINNSNKLIQYKIMDLKEFLSNYFFSYDKKTIYYLLKKLNLKYEIILEYLDSLYYIDINQKYNDKKLNQLSSLKKELIENNLIYTNSIFKNYLKKTKIIIYGYHSLDPFYLDIFNNYNYQFIDYKYTKKTQEVYEFNSIDDEIAFVCFDIKNKLDNGIAIDRIKLIISNEYNIPLKRIFNWCHIPLEDNNKISLYDITIGKDVLKQIINNYSFLEIIKDLEKTKIDKEIINLIISIFNDYIDFNLDTKELYEMIEYDFKNTYIKTNKQKNCVNIISLEELDNLDYAYLLGFNKENYPTIYKDDTLLSDNMKTELKLFTSNDKNISSIEKIKKLLNRDLNLKISYKLKTSFDVYSPSMIIIEEDMKVVRNTNITYNFSNKFNKIKLAKEYDKFYKYGISSDNMKLLSSNYHDLEYRNYDNRFTGIDNKDFLLSLKQPFSLSYSVLDNYYRCSFRYYINNILKISDVNSDEFYMQIGNIFHYVLSKCFLDDFNFEKEWNNEVNKYDLPLNKIILINKLKEELKYDILILKKQLNYTKFDKYLYEQKFTLEIPNSKNILVNFIGIIDKICFLEKDNETLVSIVDYKTGTLHHNLNNIIYGINMQLPIYLYFIKRSSLFTNISIVGFFLQKIVNKNFKDEVTKSRDELKEKALKLVGYSTDNEDNLSLFDITYSDSMMIDGLKKKNDGDYYSYSKVLSDKKIASLDKLVDQKINNAVEDILNGKFDINPKKIDKDLIGCEFCSYKDICFKTEKDIVELEKHKNLDFLGGE